jgi:uncharacterized membrane protein YfcA
VAADSIVTRLAILIGWFEIILACLAGYLCVSNLFYAFFSAGPEGEWALPAAFLMLPVSILFGWAGWALITRKPRAWQHQVILVIVVLLSVGLSLIEYGA